MGLISEETRERIARWIERRLEVDGTPGLSLAITDRNGLLHQAAFGLANLDSGAPVTTEHLFETGSIGKSFTAIALLQLAGEGKIDLQAPVTHYLPWFSIHSEHEPIRLHHLLSHTAGITSGIDFAPAGLIQVHALRDSFTSCPPGTFFHYSNLGYKVLGEVLAAVAGETYGPVIQRRILDPLGVTNSEPTITSDTRSRMPIGYSPLYDDRPWWPGRPLIPATWLETDTSDGCLAMTAGDLAIYLRMLLNRGATPGGRVLSEAGFGLMTQRAIAMEGADDPSWYGHGVVTRDVRGHTYLGHGGGMVGYFAGMIGDLDTGLGVTVLVNGPGAPADISRQLLDYLRALSEGEAAELHGPDDDTAIADAAAFAGEYLAVEGAFGPPSLSLRESSGQLSVELGSSAFPVHGYWGALVSSAPGLDLFPLTASRDEAGGVTEIVYGDTVYRRPDAAPPAPADVPAEWHALTGNYRSHNPWTTGFRVFVRQGRLWLTVASEPDGLEYEQPLVALDGGWFRCGEDERIPEYVRFDTIVEGKALVAHLSGCDFYRLNTP